MNVKKCAQVPAGNLQPLTDQLQGIRFLLLTLFMALMFILINHTTFARLPLFLGLFVHPRHTNRRRAAGPGRGRKIHGS